MQQTQELFLITILKFPVIVIKIIAKAFSIITYLPNYLILLLIDTVLFHQYLQSTILLYIVSWLPRVFLLALAGVLFTGEFYLIFEVMQLRQHGLVIQIVGMILTLAGLLILMRKGYLTLLEKYNLTKLKSPLEHIELGLYFIVDCLGILLWIINLCLVINLGQSWSYKYDRWKKYQFISHTLGLIRESLITYIQFFYVKFFFRIFKWRFIVQFNTYKKEKEEKNVLNCLVLLTLIYLMTLLDLAVIALCGLPCVLHHQRKVYFDQMAATHQKYKVTLSMFVFVALHVLQLLVQILCLVVCWKSGVSALKKWVDFKSKDELFQSQFKDLIVEAMLKVPYLFCLLFISVSVYKLKRRNLLLRKYNESKEAPNQSSNQYIWLTFSSFSELLADLLHYPFVVVVTLMKPWNILWLRYIINGQYAMEREMVRNYLFKSIVELIISPVPIVLTLLVFLYDSKKPLQLYQQAREEVDAFYQKNIQNKTTAPNPHLKNIYSGSQLCHYLVKLYNAIKQDIPHLPQYITLTATFINIYSPKLKPKTSANLLLELQRTYFYLSVVKSARHEQYELIFNRMKASGGLLTQKEQYRFWKYSYKCQRLLLVQKILGFFLPKKSVQNIKKRLQLQTRFSQIANLYWNTSEMTNKMIMRLIFLIIEIILTVIGVVILLPLTLWRIPTFLKIFWYHRSKKFFFPILKKIYVQMFNDIITLPLKVISFIFAPKMFIEFVFKTSFRYGPAGIDTFDIYQRLKYKFLRLNILQVGFIGFLVHFKLMFIVVFWTRKKQLRIFLRHYQLTLSKFYKEFLIIGPAIQPMDLMLTQLDQTYLIQFLRINQTINQVFREALVDLPYLLLMLFIFCTMPWRINYLIQAVKDMREDTAQRKSFFKLVRNIFKDYACIFMNIVLLFSIFKTKKALFLIRRNYRLNFFIGFLQYSYFKELTNQMIKLGIIYKNIIYMLVAIIFGWTRTHLLVRQLREQRQREKQEQQSAVANQKIYDNTVKSGKQLKTLHKMGYYNYISVCSFLTLPEIMKLRQVDQFNYKMTQREQIWFMKWELVYSKQSNETGQNFQLLCKRAFMAQSNNRVKITYQSIIMKHFQYNVFEGEVDLVDFFRDKLPAKYFNAVFKNYEFSFTQGYGPQNQLPQQENQDEEFLRLTNQVRRPIVELDEQHTWLHLLYARQIQFIAQKLHRYFRQDSYRRLKQLLILAGPITIISLYLSFIWIFMWSIFSIDRLIGIKIILAFYFHTFVYCFCVRIYYLFEQWVSLYPFDLYFDAVKVIKRAQELIKVYFINPLVRFAKKCGQAIKKVFVSIYKFMERSAIKTMDITQKYAVLFFQKVIKPLYIKIAQVIRKIRDSIVEIFKLIFRSIKAFLSFLKTIVTSLYEGIRAIFSNINKLYYFVLKSLMTFLLKFGVIGNLIFTLVGLVIMTLPSIIWWAFYQQRWYLVVSTIHTMVLIVVGYKHLNRIRKQKQV